MFTVVSPIHVEGELAGYAASRAHHADVGGRIPGSMPADSRRLDEEGVVLEPTRLVRRGELDREVLDVQHPENRDVFRRELGNEELYAHIWDHLAAQAAEVGSI